MAWLWFLYSLFFRKNNHKKGLNKVGETIKVSNPEISLCVEDGWEFVKNGQNIIGTDLSLDSHEQNIGLLNQIDKFLEENFKSNTVTIKKYEVEKTVTTIFFSNGLELKMNNNNHNFDDDDNWYLLIDESLKTQIQTVGNTGLEPVTSSM